MQVVVLLFNPAALANGNSNNKGQGVQAGKRLAFFIFICAY